MILLCFPGALNWLPWINLWHWRSTVHDLMDMLLCLTRWASPRDLQSLEAVL